MIPLLKSLRPTEERVVIVLTWVLHEAKGWTQLLLRKLQRKSPSDVPIPNVGVHFKSNLFEECKHWNSVIGIKLVFRQPFSYINN